MPATEEIKIAARRYADEQTPAWTLVVLTIHDADGLSTALKVYPTGEPTAPTGEATTPTLHLAVAATASLSQQ